MATRPITNTTHSPTRPRYGSLEAGAEILDCSVRTLRRLIADGELSGYRLGKRMLRIDLNEVESTLRRIPTVGPERRSRSRVEQHAEAEQQHGPLAALPSRTSSVRGR